MSIAIPEAFQDLFRTDYRYAVYYGGRGAGKSQNIASSLLIMGGNATLRILCCREVQRSMRDSVHKLLCDQITELGLGAFYEIQNDKITGKNGTEFIFAGLRHSKDSLKSLANIDLTWVEEAQTVSKASWDVLIPTIRKEGSRIIISFNPELDTDETYKRFVLDPPPKSIIKKVNWSDNPWFPEVLKEELETLKARDHDAYLTVWEGSCRQTLDGAIYAAEIRNAMADGHITKVPYDPSKPVSTFWDLGYADNTSIWFAQTVGFETRVIDFLQDSRKPLPHYLKELQARPYVYHEDWLPHDAKAKQLGTGKSIEEMMRAAGRKVRTVPKLSIADGINTVRTVFPNLWFDESKCADGINALRRYRYDVDEDGQYSRTPLHNEASHAADALRYLCIALGNGASGGPNLKLTNKFKKPRLSLSGGTGWMG